MEFLLPRSILNGDGTDPYPDPETYTYWKAREQRTFFLDYELEDNYCAIELCKIIIQMNLEERNIPEDELKPIYLFIHSFGGDTYQGNFLADLILSSRIPVITVAMGMAMSSGFIIFLAGHRRYVFNHSQLLVHEGYAAFQGTASEVEQAQKNYKKQLDDMKAYVLRRTTMDDKTFNKNKNRDWYLTNDEIEKYNIAKIISNFDEIV